MAKVKGNSRSFSDPYADTQAVVTALNYAAKAISFGQRKNYDSGAWPVIRSDAPGWADWMEYFRHIGHLHGRANSFAERVGVLTVPSLFPEEFDPGWRERDPVSFAAAEATRREKCLDSLSPEEREASRERVAGMVADLKRQIARMALGADMRNAGRDRYPHQAAE